MQLNVPDLSLVLLIGPSGAGKSTFAKKHFLPTEIVSSDTCRGIVSNNENDLNATADAFDLLNFIITKRLKNGLLTVVDATNVQAASRKKLIALAREYHALPVAIVLNMPKAVCENRNKERSDRNFGNHVIRQQIQQLKQSLRGLKREGFRKIHILNSTDEADAVESILREKLYNDRRDENGPFDIIGDVHGCFDELKALLKKLGYIVSKQEDKSEAFGFHIEAPAERRVIFLGDLVDRGPDSVNVLKLVMSMVEEGTAYCVPGNHDIKLQKWLKGKNVSLTHGLAETVDQLKGEPEDFRNKVREFLYSLISHYVFDNGNLVVAHAGIREEMQGRGSGVVRSFCLYGETTGEIDDFGLPVRYNWASEYRGKAKVVYGHTPVVHAEWLNKTIDIDTGCVFGGKLTALRYPEEELISISAARVYYEPAKPLVEPTANGLTHQQENDDILDIDDVLGKRILQTRLRNNITIYEENAIPALEVMSRFAVNPKWLIYLPPTMSPPETSALPSYLEHPTEAFAYYQKLGIPKVICEEKHMGSRVVLVLCKDEDTALKRFGLSSDGIGKCYTRTGRNFFTDSQTETTFLARIRDELTKAGFWESHKTSWVCLDCELMPWSAKAQQLLRDQYASVGAAAAAALPAAIESLQIAAERGVKDAQQHHEAITARLTAINKYTAAYQAYCWPVEGIEDYRLAPFHILATEGDAHINKTHDWHMSEISNLVEASSSILFKTPYKVVDLVNEAEIHEATDWWNKLTGAGGEGMVIKPLDYIARGSKGLVQPAIKCRGAEYLRIIYGPEYNSSDNLVRLKKRGLSRKRSLAIREFALGVESLERFVRKDPLRRIHECVFGVLALESEQVDPRL